MSRWRNLWRALASLGDEELTFDYLFPPDCVNRAYRSRQSYPDRVAEQRIRGDWVGLSDHVSVRDAFWRIVRREWGGQQR